MSLICRGPYPVGVVHFGGDEDWADGMLITVLEDAMETVGFGLNMYSRLIPSLLTRVGLAPFHSSDHPNKGGDSHVTIYWYG